MRAMAVTIDTVIDNLLDNADFEESASVAKARAFITAATQFLILSPQSQSDQGSSLTMSVQQIENLLKRARSFVEQTDTSSATSTRVKFLTAAEGFRR